MRGDVFGEYIGMAGENYLKIAVAGMCLSLLLSACQKDAGPAAASQVTPKFKQSTANKQGPTVDELTAGMVGATTAGKSSLPLELKFDLASHPTQGASLDVNLAMLPEVSGGPMDVQISGSDGFKVADSAPFEFPVVESGEVYRHTLKVTPTAQGLLLLGVTVTVKHDDGNETKTFSIPVIVDH